MSLLSRFRQIDEMTAETQPSQTPGGPQRISSSPKRANAIDAQSVDTEVEKMRDAIANYLSRFVVAGDGPSSMLHGLLRRYLKSADEDALRGACQAALEFAEHVRPYAEPRRPLVEEIRPGGTGRGVGDREEHVGALSPGALAADILLAEDPDEIAGAVAGLGHQAEMAGDDGSYGEPDEDEV